MTTTNKERREERKDGEGSFLGYGSLRPQESDSERPSKTGLRVSDSERSSLSDGRSDGEEEEEQRSVSAATYVM